MFDFEIIVDEFPNDRELKINKRTAVRGVIFHKGKLLMVKTSLGDYKFPGGGVTKGEDMLAALKREIREETGFTDVAVGPMIGHAFEQNIDNHDDAYMFQMDSYYYLCIINSLNKGEQVLDEYEQEMEFTPEFIGVDEAFIRNNGILTNENQNEPQSIGKTKMTISEWVARETKALQMLKDSYVDRLLPDIFICGQMMRNADRSVLEVDDKAGHANFVTNYDKKIQDELKHRLLSACPEAKFVGEESDEGENGDISLGIAFIVDPIDGTTNFMKDYKKSCISVGITLDGGQVAGIVYQPYADEMFCAELGKGAFLNGKPVHVSGSDLDHALVSFGTAPYYEELRKMSFAKAEEFCARCIDVRRSGSAAIDLCDVACGRVDLYFELRICPWDIAAGTIIVTEAGGKISQVDGSEITLKDKCSILATNGITYMI